MIGIPDAMIQRRTVYALAMLAAFSAILALLSWGRGENDTALMVILVCLAVGAYWLWEFRK